MIKLRIKQDYGVEKRKVPHLHLVNEKKVAIFHKKNANTRRNLFLLPDPTDPGCGIARRHPGRAA